MPNRTLRFCPKCVETQHAAGRERCRACGEELVMLLDDDGALAAKFLEARGSCCDTGCRNCPYPGEEASGAAVADKAPVAAAKKTCGKCGRGFECCSNGCWCAEIRLSEATLKRLRRAYADCLCRECLKEFEGA